MNYDYQTDLQEVQEMLEKEEKEEKKAAKSRSAQKGVKNSKKKKRYSAADLKKMAVMVEQMIRDGVTNVTHQAKALGVSHWTASKVNRLLQNRARHDAPDIQKMLIDPKDAIRKLVPLLDHRNEQVVKQAKQWLLKVAEYMD